MSLAWKKHRIRCVNPTCPKKTGVLEDRCIAAKNCQLTTRAAKGHGPGRRGPDGS
jgi:hypothetical protein